MKIKPDWRDMNSKFTSRVVGNTVDEDAVTAVYASKIDTYWPMRRPKYSQDPRYQVVRRQGIDLFCFPFVASTSSTFYYSRVTERCSYRHLQTKLGSVSAHSMEIHLIHISFFFLSFCKLSIGVFPSQPARRVSSHSWNKPLFSVDPLQLISVPAM